MKVLRRRKRNNNVESAGAELTTPPSEDKTTAIAVSSSDDEQDQPGISTLLNAAARLDSKKKENITLKDMFDIFTHASESNSDANDKRISALLEVATTLDGEGATGMKKREQGELCTKTSEHRAKRIMLRSNASSEIVNPMSKNDLNPTYEELELATTTRSRNALFSWYDRLRDLHEYKAKHGDCMVPQKYEANHALGIWVNKQRMEKRLKDQGMKSSMTDHRLKLLDRCGFNWAKHKGQLSWDDKYEELVDFFKKNGHCNVPTKFRENSALGRWISTQRAQMKEWRRGVKTSMTLDRYEKLCAIDFQFERLATKK